MQNNVFFSELTQDVQMALDEDLGQGDLTSALLDDAIQGQAQLISRENMVVCGIPWVEAVFNAIDPSIQMNWLVFEGQKVDVDSGQIQTLAWIKGSLKSILTAERTALNFLQTLSAVATKTQRFVSLIQHLPTQLLDTRKTIPKLRVAQKYAVRIGGGENHRMGLYDAILIKENHIKAAGSIQKAIEVAKQQDYGKWIEIEVENLSEFKAALTCKPDKIMLDNFKLEDLQEAVLIAKKSTSQIVQLEASGGVNEASIREIAETGVDYVSVGAITKSIDAIDLSLLIVESE